MAADQCGQERNRELISFREWAGVLAGAAAIPAARREAYRGAIIAFLGFCKRQHAGASVILIKAYLAQAPEQARSGAREALRWWYRDAHVCGGSGDGGRTTRDDRGRRADDRRQMTEDGQAEGG